LDVLVLGRWNHFVSCPLFGHYPCLVLQHTSSRFYVTEEERKTSVADEIFAWDRTVSRLMDAWQRESEGANGSNARARLGADEVASDFFKTV